MPFTSQEIAMQCRARAGLLCFDICPEKPDESNPHTTVIGWLPFGPELKAEGLKAERQFIPFFGTMQSPLLKGHMAKKDIPMPMGLTWATIRPSAMAGNSFQKAKIV